MHIYFSLFLFILHIKRMHMGLLSPPYLFMQISLGLTVAKKTLRGTVASSLYLRRKGVKNADGWT